MGSWRAGFFVVAVLLSACASSTTERRSCGHHDLALRLPWAEGERFEVMQGNLGGYSHLDERRFAWDFRMPEGTEVLASADGVVEEVLDVHDGGGADPALLPRSNQVIIRHRGGRRSIYRHLLHGGVVVRTGEVVRRGQPIALSGNTGWSEEPHLHFEVVDDENRTLPVCFVDVEGGVPLYRGIYRSGNARRAG